MIETLLENFTPENNITIWLVAAFVIAFFVAYQTFPTILYVAKEKHLMDEPDSRSVHSDKTPTLGGIGIFVGLIVVMTIIGAFLNTKVLLLIMGGLTILFFLGLKDDLTVLSAGKKFMGQLLAAGLLIVFTNTRIIGFSMIMEIDILPYWISIIFTLFVYILIINAYNLIDGVDGLAGTIALCVSGIFVYLFVNAHELSLATIAIALCGCLLAFLRLNFSSRNKIFMGDTGSMIVGFLLAFFTISFINMAQLDGSSPYFRASPALAFALLFYPLMDTLRIFFLRIVVHKTSPFKADKNHVHHRFLRSGYSHLMTTILISGINVVIIGIAFNLLHLNLNTQIILLLLYGSVLYVLPFLIKKIH
ncbi:MraY family glycosyltransferase [Winogradskyella aquimaris]|uniref:MraY family glycosyltransferase n=1 Tax=Winogradskyella aquimaris TaxID=864074 RepID=A0ABU5EQB5_9FLAO|nr:MraY family glycosyltransferase [Winogradskyella aquimaris]MDY2587071.1 MraY family glycosyltransferase [Winogradskyella aquimaris]